MRLEEVTVEWVLEHTHFEQMSGCWFFDRAFPKEKFVFGGRGHLGRSYAEIGVSGAPTQSGTTTLRISRVMLAHRLGRPLKDGMFACHHCDTAPCINPDHLYEGTAQTNADDRVRRGRMWVNGTREESLALAARIREARRARGDWPPKRKARK